MIDDKKIEEASFEETFGMYGESDSLEQGFICGAKWARDKILDNLWHSAQEEPKIGKELLVNYKTGNKLIMFLQTKLNDWKKFSNQEIKCWLYIDDLFPKKITDETGNSF